MRCKDCGITLQHEFAVIDGRCGSCQSEEDKRIRDQELIHRCDQIRRQERRSFIEEELNAGNLVQVACTYANVGLIGAYLTTSGQVCREEFGFIEDVEDFDEFASFPLPLMSWPSIVRLQNLLQDLYAGG